MARVNVQRIEVHTDDPDRWAMEMAIRFHRLTRPARWRLIAYWRWWRKLEELLEHLNEHDLVKLIREHSK